MSQLSDWLKKLGLDEYARIFAENAIDLPALQHLTDRELEDLGVAPIDREQIRRALTNTACLSPPDETVAGSPWRKGAQRRQLTIMFCDLMGSTELAQGKDPEEYSNVIWEYRETCSRIIRDNGGSVARFIGDGILAYFGYPEVHEDDPVRACRAGLAIINAIQRRNASPPLQVRIACATGLVVVGDMIGKNIAEEKAVMGTAPNLASRLQEIATPGTIVISDQTRSLIGESFEVESLGVQEFKGISQPVHVWHVLRERRFESRFAAYHKSLSQLVGRRDELDALLNCWGLAKSSGGQLVCISGEPGIGKSRLVHALREQLAKEPSTTLLYQCSAQHSSSVLRPVISQIEYAAKITLGDSPPERLRKLEELFDQRSPSDDALVQLLAELMGIPTRSRYEPLVLSPQERKIRIFAVMFDRLRHLSTLGPILLVVEDIHWVDPTTRELIEYTMLRFSEMPVLIVVTSRTELDVDLPAVRHATDLRLPRLGRDDAVRLVTALTEGKALPNEVLDTIVARTEGVPLFIEEVTKTVLKSQILLEREQEFEPAGKVPTLAIPSTLQDSLMARLDPLKSGKELAQLAAVLGRSFSYGLISQLSECSEDELLKSLHELVEADLLSATGHGSETIYTFKHAMIQDVAYEGLLHSRRRLLHGRVAAVLAASFSQVVDAQPELLAHHLTFADQFAEAASQWRRAGAMATERSANQEAVTHFKNGLAMLDRVSEPERDRQLELDMLVRLAGALRATFGYAAAEIGPLCDRALHLARDLGNSNGELQAISGLYSFHLLRSEYASAEKAAKELLEAATTAGQPTYAMVAHRAIGVVSFYFGKLKKAERSLQQALNLYDSERHASLTTLYGADHAEMCACFLSQTRWVLGATQEAIALQSWAVEHARSIKHAHSIAQALAYRSFLFCLVGDPERIEADGEEALAVAKKYGLKLMEAFAECTMSVAGIIQRPSIDRAVALGEAVDRLHAIAPNALRPFLLSLVSDFHRRLQMPEKGLALVDEADAVIRRTGECWAKAEVDRVRGALLANIGELELAERCFRSAIQTAQAQDATSWASRSAADLAALLQRTDRPDEARGILRIWRG